MGQVRQGKCQVWPGHSDRRCRQITALRIAQRGRQLPRQRQPLRIGQGRGDDNGFGSRQNIRRLDLDRTDTDRSRHTQPDVAVDTGIGQVIDLPAKGRNGRILGPIDHDLQLVFASLQQPRQTGGKRGVAIGMGDDLDAVQRNLGIGHRPVKPQRNLLPRPGRIGEQGLFISKNPLIDRFVKI